MATTSRVFLSRQTRTSPNAPRPIIFRGSKSLTVILARLFEIILGQPQRSFLSRLDWYLRHAIKLGLFVLDLLLDELFLLLAQVHLVHLDHELVPSLFLFDLLIFLTGILRFNIGFDTFGPLSCTVSWLYLLSGGGRLSRLLLLLLLGLHPIEFELRLT